MGIGHLDVGFRGLGLGCRYRSLEHGVEDLVVDLGLEQGLIEGRKASNPTEVSVCTPNVLVREDGLKSLLSIQFAA